MTRIVVNDQPLKIAVSACLLGQPVRYDGGHRYHSFVAEVLARRFELVAICPEVGAGMGVPRPTIRLVAGGDGVRVVRVDEPQHDETQRLQDYARKMVVELAGVCACVFKSRSPSCGLQSPLHPEGSSPGLFARELQRAWPQMPLVDDDQLLDGAAQRRFVAQAIAYAQGGHGGERV